MGSASANNIGLYFTYRQVKMTQYTAPQGDFCLIVSLLLKFSEISIYIVVWQYVGFGQVGLKLYYNYKPTLGHDSPAGQYDLTSILPYKYNFYENFYIIDNCWHKRFN